MQKTIIFLTLVAFTALLPLNLGAYAFTADKPIQRVYDDASLNWAGYYVKGTDIGFANATWTVPTVVNTVSGDSSAWIGIGGVNGNGLIQTGTEQDCSTSTTTAGEVKFHGPVIEDKPQSGSKGSGGGSTHCNPIYYAWWETYPANAEQKITTMTISPGDKMNAEIVQTATPGVWTISLYDLTHFQSFSTTVTFNPDQTTAESIIERPSLCSAHCKLTNLADFQTINFLDSVSGTTVASQVAFDADPTHTIIYMVDSSSRLMAQPGALSSPGAFSTTWLRNN